MSSCTRVVLGVAWPLKGMLLEALSGVEYFLPPYSRLRGRQQENVSRGAKHQGQEQHWLGRKGERRQPGKSLLEVDHAWRHHHLVLLYACLQFVGDPLHYPIGLGNFGKSRHSHPDQGLGHVVSAGRVVPEILCVGDAHGHLHEVSCHELVLHGEAVLTSAEQGFEVCAANGQGEGPDIF
jgi:hypothetical protein